MTKYWAMKTFKDWAEAFVRNSEVGIDEQEVDEHYISYETDEIVERLENPRIVRRFDQFCKWATEGDYVIVGVGKTTQFHLKLIAKIIGEYEFDKDKKDRPYRHYRKIEIMKVFNEPVPIDKWGQIQRIERIDDNDFIDTLIKVL